jgi:outer membrane immunogenic protein
MRRWSTVCIATVSTVAFIQIAAAADLPVKAPAYKPPPPVAYWTGFYVGINGGYSWGPWDSADLSGITTSPKVDGWLGGLQAGYNWQIDRTWVIGLEGDVQITGERRSQNGTTSTLIPFSSDFHFVETQTVGGEWKFPWFATFRGRVGALLDPTLLLYVTGGLAVGEFKVSSNTTTTLQRFLGTTSTTPSGAPVTVGTSLSQSTTRAGWTLGAGLEKKFTPNWSAKLEYLYLDFGENTFFSSTGSDLNVKLRDHIVRAGLNYRFN